ncbi:N-acetylmuramoyl-L-alanine amidase [Alkalihalobacillus oceani]|uniref:peptidoglycan recognition protein family protein n=1 Tax=Halalkalibacter oceani TaxID=1653776 RepID=UPI002041D4A8|nr:N-acetylmuramoyl-L-alanine amidase [Halalkalibacter oceani]MCM3761150.1 N-acetylmuramoyl-L-alanine amidase [Halalkalibacter oceani]
MQIRQDFIPASNRNRPGTRIIPTHLTIHETANRSRGADALTHARYVKGEDAQNRQVSWHYTVDDQYIIQHLPNHELGWHAGSEGNRQSLGIELCVNSDGDFEQTKRHAQWLIARLMRELSIPIDRVVTHQHWTGKNCPAILLPTFDQFKRGVVQMSNQTPSSWAEASWNKALAKGIMNEGQGPKEALTREQLAVILDRLGKLD